MQAAWDCPSPSFICPKSGPKPHYSIKMESPLRPGYYCHVRGSQLVFTMVGPGEVLGVGSFGTPGIPVTQCCMPRL